MNKLPILQSAIADFEAATKASSSRLPNRSITSGWRATISAWPRTACATSMFKKAIDAYKKYVCDARRVPAADAAPVKERIARLQEELG